MLQEGEEANTTVDSEGKEEVAAAEPKPPRELTAEELEAKVHINPFDHLLMRFYLSNDENLSSVLSRLE